MEVINSFRKYLKQLIIIATFFSGFVAFSQVSNNTKLDSLLATIKEEIRVMQYSNAQILTDSIYNNFIFKSELDKVKVDFYQARIYIKTGKNEKALTILLDGFKKLQSYKKSKYYSETASNIGYIFTKSKNYKKAHSYYKMQMNNALGRKDSSGICISYLNLGSSFYRQGVIDSAKYYYNKVIFNFPKSETDKSRLSRTYSNLTGIYLGEEKYDLAIDYGEKALLINRMSKDTLGISGALMNLGSTSYLAGDYDIAEGYYNQAYEILKDKDDYISDRNKRAALLNLSWTLSEANNFEKAYKFLERHRELEANFNIENNKSKIAEIEAKYNLSEKEKQAAVEKNKRQKAEFWIYVFGGSSIALLLFLWLFYKNQKIKREKKELVYQKENLLQERKFEKAQNDAQVKILNATLDGKELERRLIAEVLHDSVSTMLSSVGLHLQAAKAVLKKNVPKEIEKSQAIVEEAGEKIRDLSHKLISPSLLKFGLGFAVEDLCEKYSNSQLTFETDARNVGRYKRGFEIKLHSIIEEFLNNVLKHSNAQTANVLLSQSDGKLQVRIIDDGNGFDVQEVRENNKGGLGLAQIEARIKMMSGVFKLNSKIGEGTRVFMSIPIADQIED